MSYVDIAVLVLVALCAVIGVLRGIKKSALSFGAFLVAFLISFFLAKVVAEALLGVAMIRSFVIGSDGFSLYTWLNSKIVVGESVTFAGGTAPSQFIVNNYYNPIIELVSQYTGISESFNVSNAVALCSAFTVFTAIVGVGLFIVIRILLCLVTMIIKALIGKRKSALSRLGGFVVGAVHGVCWSLALTIVFGFVGGFTFVKGLDVAEGEYERGVISPYVNTAAYAIKNKLLLPDLEMFSRIVDKSGLVVKDEDKDPEHDIMGTERDLYIVLMNLNYSDTAYTVSDSGVIEFIATAHKIDPSEFEQSGYDTVVAAIMQFNEDAAKKIREDRILGDADQVTLGAYINTLRDSSNSIFTQWTRDVLAYLRTYEAAIDEGKTKTSQDEIETANQAIKTAYMNLKNSLDLLQATYSQVPLLGELTFEHPAAYAVATPE